MSALFHNTKEEARTFSLMAVLKSGSLPPLTVLPPQDFLAVGPEDCLGYPPNLTVKTPLHTLPFVQSVDPDTIQVLAVSHHKILEDLQLGRYGLQHSSTRFLIMYAPGVFFKEFCNTPCRVCSVFKLEAPLFGHELGKRQDLSVQTSRLKHLSNTGRPRATQWSLRGNTPIQTGSITDGAVAAAAGGVQVLVAFGVSAAREAQGEGLDKRCRGLVYSALNGVLQEESGEFFHPGMILQFRQLPQRCDLAPGQIPNGCAHAHPQPGYQAVELLNHFFQHGCFLHTARGAGVSPPGSNPPLSF
ncbi:unnamed protein product [Trypanosoma congolense IL3000]|uniref:WGS project CAEQ00000000 data, annotated contig 1981 n=1 Tax=Trypanosoma congolense (strain IL3000) TaxID=1068625 RepID=F9WAJ6_TRYCI|nr:unnamed protein product [Trypanosoma congolense IL3000]